MAITGASSRSLRCSRPSRTCRGHELEQLFRRVVFSVLTGNTDDYLRNHGFLRKGRAWTLSPAYDLNPNPYSTGVQSTSPGIDDATASVELACSVAGLLPSDLRSGQGDRRRDRVEHDTMGTVPTSFGASASEIELMAQAYEGEPSVEACCFISTR